MVFGQVVRVETRGVEPLDLHQAITVDFVQLTVRDRLDMIKYAELKSHALGSAHPYPDPDFGTDAVAPIFVPRIQSSSFLSQ